MAYMPPKTYLLAPNLTTHPGGSFAVGTIIADPLRPLKPLSVASESLDIVTHTETERDISNSTSSSLSAAIWAQFLQIASAKLSGHASKELQNSYSVDRLDTVALREEPSDEYAAERANEPKVRATMNAGVLGRQPVYMITGLKIARGFRWTREQGRSLQAEAGASVPITDQVTAGAEIGGERGTTHRDAGRTDEDIIFAYQLHIIAEKGWRKKRTVADQYVPKGGLLRKKSGEGIEQPVDAMPATADELQEIADDNEDNVQRLNIIAGDERCLCLMAEV